MSNPPTKRGVTVSTEWPFIHGTESEETRTDHALMALLLAIATAAALPALEPAIIMTALLAFFTGFAFQNWLSFPTMYDTEVNDE